MALEIIRGLLGADLIGFRPRPAANFLRLVRRHLHLRSAPTPSSCPTAGCRGTHLPDLDRRPGVRRPGDQRQARDYAKKFCEELGNPRRIFLGVDRLDYTKGLIHRIRAFGELFEAGDLDPDHDVFVQVASPSRENVAEYVKLRDEIELMVGRINGDVSRIGRPPILYLHSSYPRLAMAAMYSVADVMVVTPLRDGMNLVCKEYVACRTDQTGALVLSEFAGAAEELRQAYLVNPYDLNGMKSTLLRAANASRREKQRRMRALRKQIFEHDINRWADNFLTDLAQFREAR